MSILIGSFATAKDFEDPDDDDSDGSYAVTVQVSDGRLTGTAPLTVTLRNVNEAPTADAGPDQFGLQAGAGVTLSGSGSDPDANDSLSYLWTRSSGPEVTLVSADTETATFTVPAGIADQVTFTFTLRVTDEASLFHEDTVSLTVGGQAPGAPSITSARTLPAAENQTAVATLTATDADTQAADLTWSIPSGADGGVDGGKFTLSASGVLAFATAKDFEDPDDDDANGSYQVRVQVSDGAQRDRVLLTVTLTNVNEAPTANAGPDQALVVSGETVTLGGSGRDPDADDSLSYLWTRTSGPQVTLRNASTATATFTAPSVTQAADITFTLRVTDGASLYHEDTLVVRVYAPLTAAFENEPSGHDGVTEFSLRIRFSENVILSAAAFGSGLLSITNGTLRDQRRLSPGSDILWEIDVLADGVDDDVIITLPANRACDPNATPCTPNGRRLSAEASVTVAAPTPAGTVVLNVDAVTGDDAINIAEKAAGFSITGDTGSVSGVSVTVQVGSQTLRATSADDAGTATWSVDVPADAQYIEGTEVALVVSASKPFYRSPAAERRSLLVDLVSPVGVFYPSSPPLKVGESVAALSPRTTHTDIVSYRADSLPPGLSIDGSTGVITGTPNTAKSSLTTSNVTVTDRGGNTSQASVHFNSVAKGDQTLTGFTYSANSVALTGTAPTLTEPNNAQGTLSYSAHPSGVCRVNSTTGELSLVGAGVCTITATAAGDANWNEASDTFRLVVQGDETLELEVFLITSDNTINSDEKAAGFDISGNTGSRGGVDISVQMGSEILTAVSRLDFGTASWSVSVPADADYITGSTLAVTVTASKEGFMSADPVGLTLSIDLAPPVAPTYEAPLSLKMGEEITVMLPSGGSDISLYFAPDLPSGLEIDGATGDISGTPDSANTMAATATVYVEDTAGNRAEVDITFPTVAKGEQSLSGFRYSARSVSLGSTAPTVTPPNGARGALSYSASPSDVCSVDASNGDLTLEGAGDCVITVTAAGDANYNSAEADYTVTVQSGNSLVLHLNTIAGDNAVNLAEKTAGFSISGHTGTEEGVSVSVVIGTATLTDTSADPDASDNDETATWSVDVPADAAYITETSVQVTVSASKAEFTAPGAKTRTLTVDLTAPVAPTYTAPLTLKVGVVLATLSPSGGEDIVEYSASGLPAGLSIDGSNGEITGRPEAANTNTRHRHGDRVRRRRQYGQRGHHPPDGGQGRADAERIPVQCFVADLRIHGPERDHPHRFPGRSELLCRARHRVYGERRHG